MNVTIPIPDDFAARFGSEAELQRHVLEVLAVNEYRAGRMSRAELRQLLGLGGRGELDGFLMGHGSVQAMATDETEQDLADTRRELLDESKEERQAAAAELVERFKAFRAGKTLAGLNLKDFITEGRR